MVQQKSQTKFENNYLVGLEKPSKENSAFYEPQKKARTSFSRVVGQQSHSLRRKLILKDHPNVASCLVPDKPYTLLLTLIVVPLGLFVIYFSKDLSWQLFLLNVYFFGATLCHILHVLIHDLTHLSGFMKPNTNRLLAMFCNIPMGVPSAMTFGKYHADHHNFLGEIEYDPDFPLRLEAKWSMHNIYKSFFLFLYTFEYALKPLLLYPKMFTLHELLNIIFIVATDYAIVKQWGWSALLFMILSSFFATGPHPTALHLIAQHYQFVEGMETFDYLGPMNIINLNMGYHIEHHDFPMCPWYNLPKIRALAPEYYQYLPHHTSYLAMAWKFLTDHNFNLYFRTERIPPQSIVKEQ